jgi:hypothetical protein
MDDSLFDVCGNQVTILLFRNRKPLLMGLDVRTLPQQSQLQASTIPRISCLCNIQVSPRIHCVFRILCATILQEIYVDHNNQNLFKKYKFEIVKSTHVFHCYHGHLFKIDCILSPNNAMKENKMNNSIQTQTHFCICFRKNAHEKRKDIYFIL